MTGLRVDELAERTRWPAELLEELLVEDERRGIVERDAGRWRLTASAEARFGPELLKLDPPSERS